MSITIASCFPGHWVRTYSTMTTVTINGGVGFANSNTTTSDDFRKGPNSYGQSGVQISFYNESEKDIKYVSFKVFPLNSVMDLAGSPIVLKAEGPIKKHSVNKRVWSYIWNNQAIQNAVITDVTIEYFDGSKEKQSTNPKEETKALQVDGSVGFTFFSPILLASVLAVGTIVRDIWLTGTRFMSSIFMLTFALLSIATIYASRQMKNKRATVAGAGMILLLGIVNGIVNLSSTYGARTLYRYEQAMSSLNIIMKIGTIVMCTILILSASGTIKIYSKRRILVVATLAILCTCATVLGGIVAVQKLYFNNTFLLLLGIDTSLPMVLWGLLASVANRCRNNYNIA